MASEEEQPQTETNESAEVEMEAGTTNTGTEEAPATTTETHEPAQSTSEADNFEGDSLKKNLSSFVSFPNERALSLGWIIFTAAYWTMIVWIPALIDLTFLKPGLWIYCVGMVAVSAMGYSVKVGIYPSGYVEGKEPGYYMGRGRYAALFLVCALMADLLGISYKSLSKGNLTEDEITKACFHFISCIWASVFFYYRFNKNNPDLAWYAFWGEWFDIIFTMAVIFVLHNNIETKGGNIDKGDTCFKESVCVAYWVFMCIQLSGWLIPMIAINGWGSQKNSKIVAVHLACLDLLTDLPLVIVAISERAYKWHWMVVLDILWKSGNYTRSIAYYGVYYIWLNGGLKGIHDKMKSKEKKINSMGLEVEE